LIHETGQYYDYGTKPDNTTGTSEVENQDFDGDYSETEDDRILCIHDDVEDKPLMIAEDETDEPVKSSSVEEPTQASDKPSLPSSIISKKEQKNKPHKCPQQSCSKKFSKAHYLKRHQKTHSSKKELPHACNHCGKKFLKKDHLMQHLNRHIKTQSFKCNICNRKFGRKFSWKKHLQSQHARNNKPRPIKPRSRIIDTNNSQIPKHTITEIVQKLLKSLSELNKHTTNDILVKSQQQK
jgi:uncharacterized Zn-finger protein